MAAEQSRDPAVRSKATQDKFKALQSISQAKLKYDIEQSVAKTAGNVTESLAKTAPVGEWGKQTAARVKAYKERGLPQPAVRQFNVRNFGIPGTGDWTYLDEEEAKAMGYDWSKGTAEIPGGVGKGGVSNRDPLGLGIR
jgi:hypothetical protein